MLKKFHPLKCQAYIEPEKTEYRQMAVKLKMESVNRSEPNEFAGWSILPETIYW